MILKLRLERDDIKALEKPDDKRPTLEAYICERLSKAVTSVECVINPSTGSTSVIVGAGDGTDCLLNSKLQIIPSHKVKLIRANKWRFSTYLNLI